MSSYAISSCDEEILNALTIADDIRKEFVSNSVSENSCNVLYESGDSERTSSVISSTNDSAYLKGLFCHMNEICDSLKFDTQFQTLSQDLQTLYLMNDLLMDRKRMLEIETISYVKECMLTTQEILSESILNKRLESINLVVKHVVTIANQMSRIKQALQGKPLKSTLKVSPSCQEDVIQVFHTADAIIKKMQEDADVHEFSDKKFTKVIPINEMALNSKLQSIITELERRLDILKEFRDRLSTTEDMESGIEMGISESGKSELPKFLSEQISSTDSGLNSSLNP